MEHKQIIVGDYVFTPCKNAFNSKTSYWISKKGYAVALYAFTPTDSADLKRMTEKKSLDSYIRYFKSAVENNCLNAL
ncbi:MAG: hypothetical protein J5966_00565 [Lachnospiraceae bacterium]|nr:hypothetical protein [Lachnospiraceae bacterium]